MKAKVLIMFSNIFLCTGCTSKLESNISNEYFSYTVKGPIATDTTFKGDSIATYQKYALRIDHLKEDIFIPFYRDSNVYDITSFIAFKEITKDSLLSAGSTVDYFSQDFRLLEQEKNYELSFFLRELGFVPDTMIIYFKYYLDSLTSMPRSLEFIHSSYTPLK